MSWSDRQGQFMYFIQLKKKVWDVMLSLQIISSLHGNGFEYLKRFAEIWEWKLIVDLGFWTY